MVLTRSSGSESGSSHHPLAHNNGTNLANQQERQPLVSSTAEEVQELAPSTRRRPPPPPPPPPAIKPSDPPQSLLRRRSPSNLPFASTSPSAVSLGRSTDIDDNITQRKNAEAILEGQGVPSPIEIYSPSLEAVHPAHQNLGRMNDHVDYTNSQQRENEETGDDEIPRRDDVYYDDNSRDNIHEATENTEPSLTTFLQIRTLTPKEKIIFTWPIHIFRRRSGLRHESSKKRRPSADVNSEQRKKVCDGRHNWRDNNKQFSDNNRGEIARILIPQDGFDSARHLAQCLVEASSSGVFGTKYSLFHEEDIGWDSATEDHDCNEGGSDRDWRNLGNIAGVFRERDRAYIPISAIHLNPTNFAGDVLCIQRPPPTTPQRPTRSTLKYASIFQSFIEVLGVVLVSLISYHAYNSLRRDDLDYLLEKAIEKSHQILESAIAVPFHLSNVFVELPLKELYRHGPSFLGWEGDSLPRICARITYHGDPEFWSLNMDECQRVYDSKEAAALHVWKPILMLIWAIGVFCMVRSILATWALRRRERLDPDMVETYQAIRMLVRQFRRAMDSP